MARLPNPGGDSGNWGSLLNTFLRVSHNEDGTLKNAVSSNTTGISGADQVRNVVAVTQQEYNQITNPLRTTLYLIIDS
jgi:hypothetical protein